MAVLETDVRRTISENSFHEPVIHLEYLVPAQYLPSADEMLSFEPHPDMIAMESTYMGEDHSPDHFARVLYWTMMYRGYFAARGKPLDQDESKALNYYAIFHDSQRLNDGYDKLHGKRGGQNARLWLKGRENQRVIDLTDYFCRVHVPYDGRVERFSQPLSYAAKIAKDSDMVDRGRGCNDLDRSYCRLPVTQFFIHHARQLHNASLQVPTGSFFSRPIQAGLELGMIRA